MCSRKNDSSRSAALVASREANLLLIGEKARSEDGRQGRAECARREVVERSDILYGHRSGGHVHLGRERTPCNLAG